MTGLCILKDYPIGIVVKDLIWVNPNLQITLFHCKMMTNISALSGLSHSVDNCCRLGSSDASLMEMSGFLIKVDAKYALICFVLVSFDYSQNPRRC